MSAAHLLDDWANLMDAARLGSGHPQADAAQPEAAPEPCTSEQAAGSTKVNIPVPARVLVKVSVPAKPVDLRESARTPDSPPADLKKPDVDTQADAAPRPNNPKLHDPADPMTDSEQRLVEKWVGRFTGKGIPMLKARKVAERLVRRDRQLDDRRSCVECESFRARRCIQGRQPFGGGGIEVLHRCSGFRLDGGNHD